MALPIRRFHHPSGLLGTVPGQCNISLPAVPLKISQPEEPLEVSPKSAGSVFGTKEDPFELQERIQGGGQGEVFVCTYLSTGQEYAAKIIHFRVGRRDERRRAEVSREIAVMETLHHPRVVNMHAHFWASNSVIIVMDLATGGDLCAKIEEESRATTGAFPGLGGSELGPRHVARQVLDGLGYMHHNGVIHRDLKSENILISASHTTIQGCVLYDIQIADFGLSKLVRNAIGSQTPGGGGGDRRYAAPERLEHACNPSFTFDERTADFWSFGVLVYLTLSGELPYSNPKHPNIAETESWQQVSEDGQDFVRGLLRKDPSERLCLEKRRSCLVHPWLVHEFVGVNSPRHKRLKGQATPTKGAICQIGGRSGSMVDCVELQLRSSTSLRYSGADGGRGGADSTPFRLLPDELVIGVMQEGGSKYLGNALVFYTSNGRVCSLEGDDCKDRGRFVAPAGSEITGLQFERSLLTGVFLQNLDQNGSAVESISGMAASAVDEVSFHLKNGCTRRYGEKGGKSKGPFPLEHNEYITIIEQVRRDWFLGSALIFYTSAGRVIRLGGPESHSTNHFSAPAGHQICGLSFEGSCMTAVHVCARSAFDIEQPTLLKPSSATW